MFISESIKYVGTSDTTLDLFEGQYPIPNGVTYNSYVIIDEKIAIMDTCDIRKKEEWLVNIKTVLNGKKPDYLVVSHMEPDHSASISILLQLFPQIQIIGNKTTFVMLKNFTGIDYTSNALVVAENDEIELGQHILKFYAAPMVHWPEVMVTYEKTEKILFSADAFGRFGTSSKAEINDDARRYYFNIVGKYGVQVLALLAKASTLDIDKICPLHGPILIGDEITQHIVAYKIWASYQAEEPQSLTIAYASIYGNTKNAAEILASNYGGKVELFDLSRCDMSQAVSTAFKNGKLVLASSTYDAGIFTPMDNFIKRLKSKAFQNRKVAFIENGTWSPQTARLMRAEFEQMKNIEILDYSVKIFSAVSENNKIDLKTLAAKMMDF